MKPVTRKVLHWGARLFLLGAALIPEQASLRADADLNRALRRAQYLLQGTMPKDEDFAISAANRESYQSAVRSFIESEQFYDVVLRYHQRIFGVGLPVDYMEELQKDTIDGKENKLAAITCSHSQGANARFRCFWTSTAKTTRSGGCPEAFEQATNVFWYPGVVAWVCPTIVQTCGTDLSNCFIRHDNEEEAKNSELGVTETFDSRFAVISSLSRQAAGIATAVAVENYPYTKILEPGLTAIDGAVAHFYRQPHHFKIDQLHLSPEVLQLVKSTPLTNTRFRLLKTSGDNYESGGVLTTFGWLRRYEKNRTRANQLYERLLCRKFTSELPRIFPLDAGDLRNRDGCKGCHATLDPLADFYKVWGEGGGLYDQTGAAVETTFNNKSGIYVSDLADIIRGDKAFATCQVQHVWQWLIGRKFYHDEDALRTAFTDYFIETDYSFKELVYAIATHPLFTDKLRGNAVVTDPLQDPPLGEAPNDTNRACTKTYSYATDIAPAATQYCTSCHSDGSGTRQPLTSLGQWQSLGGTAVSMMASGQMPPGQSSPSIQDFKERVRCWLEDPKP